MTNTPHFNQAGEAHIVDISEKSVTQRIAITEGYIAMQPETLKLITEIGHKKGDVLAIARIAGIMACKKTAELIPLCHPIFITHVEIDLTPEIDNNRVRCQATVKTTGQTGVEMEALT
ncbi:MAG: cyclic pyranopterin monophosphate synthase MoaC, partial [Methyloglobulus sp.]|nr:cyclic pyranopterin monophosphate synthase MoaC [Methyloglobulus sp.]